MERVRKGKAVSEKASLSGFINEASKSAEDFLESGLIPDLIRKQIKFRGQNLINETKDLMPSNIKLQLAREEVELAADKKKGPEVIEAKMIETEKRHAKWGSGIVLGRLDLKDAPRIIPEATSLLRQPHANWQLARRSHINDIKDSFKNIDVDSDSDRAIAAYVDGLIDETGTITELGTKFDLGSIGSKTQSLTKEELVAGNSLRKKYYELIEEIRDKGFFGDKDIGLDHAVRSPGMFFSKNKDISTISSIKDALNNIDGLTKYLHFTPELERVKTQLLPKYTGMKKDYAEYWIKVLEDQPVLGDEFVNKIGRYLGLEKGSRIIAGLRHAYSLKILGGNISSVITNTVLGSMNNIRNMGVVDFGKGLSQVLKNYSASRELLEEFGLGQLEKIHLGKVSKFEKVRDWVDYIGFYGLSETDLLTKGIALHHGLSEGLEDAAKAGYTGFEAKEFAKQRAIKYVIETQQVQFVIDQAPMFSAAIPSAFLQFYRPTVQQADLMLKDILAAGGFKRIGDVTLKQFVSNLKKSEIDVIPLARQAVFVGLLSTFGAMTGSTQWREKIFDYLGFEPARAGGVAPIPEALQAVTDVIVEPIRFAKKGYTKDTEKALRRFSRSLPIPFENQARKIIRYTPSEDEEPRKIGSTVLDELTTGERLHRMFLPGPSLKQKKERDLIEAFRLPKKSKLFGAEWYNDWLSERRERKIEEAQEELVK